MSDTRISEKTHAAQTAGGGRHYPGRGLGPEPPWRCPSCDREHATPIANGCPPCIEAATQALRTLSDDQLRALNTAQAVRQAANTLTAPPIRRALPALVTQAKAATDFEAILRKVLDEYAGKGVQVSIVNDHIGVPAATAVDPDDYRASNEIYAEYIGLQLILASLDAGAADPLLPSLDVMTKRIAYIEALPRMQEYFLLDPAAAAEPPVPPASQENPS